MPCFMLSWIVIPSWWILSNHLDFSNCNFVLKLLNPGSPKLPTINCFPMRELWFRKLFHWQFVFTKIWYNQKQPNKARPKILSCCDEIMHRDEITGLDGNFFKGLKNQISRELKIKSWLASLKTLTNFKTPSSNPLQRTCCDIQKPACYCKTWHWQSGALTTRLDLIRKSWISSTRLDLIQRG